MATYPSGIYSPTSLTDGIDDVLASHQNLPNDEIVAIETAIGVNPTTIDDTVAPAAPSSVADFMDKISNVVKTISGSTTWTNAAAAAIMKSIGTTKGDLIAFTGSATPVRFAGSTTDGDVLTRGSTETSGIKWSPLPVATSTLSGTIEIATNAETLTGTSTTLAITPDDLSYSGAFTGWIPNTNTWTYATADDPIFTLTVNTDLTGVIGVGDRIKLTQTTAKYFIVHAISYSAPNTTITIYGGTDYDLANAAITSPYYSHAKSPFGFPMTPAKWTVTLTDTSDRTQTTPTQDTWYNLGSISTAIPIGVWNVDWQAFFSATSNGSQTAANMWGTLSTTNNSETDNGFTGVVSVQGASGTLIAQATCLRMKLLTLAAKTTYYFNVKTSAASMASIVEYNSTVCPLLVRMVDTYL